MLARAAATKGAGGAMGLGDVIGGIGRWLGHDMCEREECLEEKREGEERGGER